MPSAPPSTQVVPIVPAISTLSHHPSSLSTAPSPTKSTSSSLNPKAAEFIPSPPKSPQFQAPIVDFIPTQSSTPQNITADVVGKMGDLALADSTTVKSTGDEQGVLASSIEGVGHQAQQNLFVLVCNTKKIPDALKSHEALCDLVKAHGFPQSIQLNILTGPRLPLIQSIAPWLQQTLGMFMVQLQQIQVMIVRTGEVIDGNWAMPYIDFERFSPLTNFVMELVKAVPTTTKIVWGGESENTQPLRTQLFLEATSVVSQTSEKCSCSDSYSEIIDGNVMSKLALPHLQLQGKKCYAVGTIPKPLTLKLARMPPVFMTSAGITSPDRSGASSRSSNLNPNATPFIPIWTPNTPVTSSFGRYPPLGPNEPFIGQVVDVDALRQKDWVPAVWDFGPEYRGFVHGNANYQLSSGQQPSAHTFGHLPAPPAPPELMHLQTMSPSQINAQARMPRYDNNMQFPDYQYTAYDTVAMMPLEYAANQNHFQGQRHNSGKGKKTKKARGRNTHFEQQQQISQPYWHPYATAYGQPYMNQHGPAMDPYTQPSGNGHAYHVNGLSTYHPTVDNGPVGNYASYMENHFSGMAQYMLPNMNPTSGPGPKKSKKKNRKSKNKNKSTSGQFSGQNVDHYHTGASHYSYGSPYTGAGINNNLAGPQAFQGSPHRIQAGGFGEGYIEGYNDGRAGHWSYGGPRSTWSSEQASSW